MQLEELKNKVKEFDKKSGFDKTEFKKLLEMIQEELNILKSTHRREIINHELTDILILIMQVGYKFDVDFEYELVKWFDKSEKYVKQNTNNKL